MISYEEIKDRVDEYKPRLVYAGCLVLMFLIGFGSGNAWGPDQKQKNQTQTQSKYTTTAPQNKEISKEADTKPEPVEETKTATPNATTTSKTCTTIKGNIGNGTKIYHVPGGSFYERTQEEMCFATEAEAQAAGYKKSSR